MPSYPVSGLTLRTRERGGPVSAGVKRLPYAYQLPSGSKVVFFIHGYNVNFYAARKAYLKFQKLLDSVTDSRFCEPVCEVFWPGDMYESWGLFFNPIMSAASYPVMIKAAKDCGQHLADFVRNQFPAGVDLHCVCHSMGNRFLLEFIKALNNASGIRIRSTTLMAAAVPVRRVSASGDLGQAANPGSGNSVVLHSRWDTILREAFPLGELFEEGGGWSEAVGMNGNPSAVWGNRCHQMRKYGHGDYWGGSESAERVANQLDYTTANRLPTNAPPSNQIAPPNKV